MVVGHGFAAGVHEVLAEFHGLRQLPHLIDQEPGVGHRDAFAGESGALGPDHVQQNAVARAWVAHVARVVLRAEAPAVSVLGTAVIFGVEEDDIDAEVGRTPAELAGNFQQYADAAGPVIGAVHDGFRVGFQVGIGHVARVPVGGQHDAVHQVGAEAADDVRPVQRRPRVGRSFEILAFDGGAVAFQFTHQPLLGGCVRGRVHNAGAEGHLPGHVGVGRIRVETGHGRVVQRRIDEGRGRGIRGNGGGRGIIPTGVKQGRQADGQRKAQSGGPGGAEIHHGAQS